MSSVDKKYPWVYYFVLGYDSRRKLVRCSSFHLFSFIFAGNNESFPALDIAASHRYVCFIFITLNLTLFFESRRKNNTFLVVWMIIHNGDTILSPNVVFPIPVIPCIVGVITLSRGRWFYNATNSLGFLK